MLTLAGGIIGYVQASSMASLIAGSVAGIIILIAAFLLPGKRVAGLTIGLIISLALAGRFAPVFLKTGDWMPAGMMAILSVIGLVLSILAFVKRS